VASATIFALHLLELEHGAAPTKGRRGHHEGDEIGCTVVLFRKTVEAVYHHLSISNGSIEIGKAVA
jgi:hypothetical protein